MSDRNSRRHYFFPTLFFLLCFSLICHSDWNTEWQKKSANKKKRPTPTPTFQTLRWEEAGVPAELAILHRDCKIGNAEDLTLNLLRFGKEAYVLGHRKFAAIAFDHALDRMEMIIADDSQAKKAHSKFRGEEIKPFKGEPFERSLAYLYRGILFMQEGDFQNARACFRAGQLADAAADASFSGDYVLLYYLEGKCNQALGDIGAARDAFRWAGQSYESIYLKSAILPPRKPVNAILILAEAGPPPLKYGFGRYNQELAYARQMHKLCAQSCCLRINGRRVAGSDEPIENTFFQAITRGPRIADSYNRGKAAFKDFTAVTGGIGVAAGAAFMSQADNTSQLAVGAGVMLLGALICGMSDATKPNADVRQWDNLPDSYYLFVLEADEPFQATVEYLDVKGEVVALSDLGWITPSDRDPTIIHAFEGRRGLASPAPGYSSIASGVATDLLPTNEPEVVPDQEMVVQDLSNDEEVTEPVVSGESEEESSTTEENLHNLEEAAPPKEPTVSATEINKPEEATTILTDPALIDQLETWMSTEEVKALLGKPSQALEFGNSSQWNYTHLNCHLLFHKGKLVNIEKQKSVP